MAISPELKAIPLDKSVVCKYCNSLTTKVLPNGDRRCIACGVQYYKKTGNGLFSNVLVRVDRSEERYAR